MEKLQISRPNKKPVNINSLLDEWEKFYRDIFGLELELGEWVVPARRRGFDRLIVVARGMTPEKLYKKCRKLFSCSETLIEGSLNQILHSERSSKVGVYAVWIRDRVEADEELKGLSAKQLAAQNIVGITVEERLLYEIKYFIETGGKHLDTNNTTLCSGSRGNLGVVPGVGWGLDGLEINWYDPTYSSPRLRARQVRR